MKETAATLQFVTSQQLAAQAVPYPMIDMVLGGEEKRLGTAFRHLKKGNNCLSQMRY